MAKKPFEVKARLDEADIFIYDDIGDSFDGTTAKSFAAELKGVRNARQLNIFINSPGGSVFDGVAIFNQIKRHRGRKVVNIDGIAASIASVIAMAGDEINIAANGMVMIHDPWALSVGTANDMRKMADNLDKVRDTILDTYVARTNEDRDFVSEMMEEETWMTAQEALELGFADNITGEVALAAKVSDFDLSKFKHTPENLASVQTESKGGDEAPIDNVVPLSIAKMRQRLKRRKITRGASPAQQAAE